MQIQLVVYSRRPDNYIMAYRDKPNINWNFLLDEKGDFVTFDAHDYFKHEHNFPDNSIERAMRAIDISECIEIYKPKEDTKRERIRVDVRI